MYIYRLFEWNMGHLNGVYMYMDDSNKEGGNSNGLIHMWECDSDHSRGNSDCSRDNSDWAYVYIYIGDSNQ